MADAKDSPIPNPITTFNSITSPLLLLPGELRNQIWEYALGNHTYRIRRTPNSFYDVYLSHPPAHHLALLSTCRQIHAEALMLPFSLSTFSFGVFGVCQDFSTGLPLHQRNAITSLAIGPDFDHWGWYWFVRHMKEEEEEEEEGASVRDLFPGVKEVRVDGGFHEFDETRPHWRHSLEEDAVGMKGLLMRWLKGEDEGVKVGFGVVLEDRVD